MKLKELIKKSSFGKYGEIKSYYERKNKINSNHINYVNRKENKKMYEVTYSINGLIKKINISATDSNQVFEIITNMYGSGIEKVSIINIIRK